MYSTKKCVVIYLLLLWFIFEGGVRFGILFLPFLDSVYTFYVRKDDPSHPSSIITVKSKNVELG